ncbi:MAG: hypothetical protein HY695_02165 [Deltaproteobacteria bacterium]|nr:hypothetical protein [Deltaproteobacteria bacterium]
MKFFTLALLTAVMVIATATAGTAGEYHAGGTLLCYDCHTMHFSMQHGWGGGAVGTTPEQGGNWLSTTGPNTFLLKAPANELCLSCHNGSSVAPDVLEANANASPASGRSAGALNETGAGPYETWKGHTLGSTATPPGYVGSYTPPDHGLECTQCHTQHGRAAAYRNLGPRSIPDSSLSYVIGSTNDLTKHVWINIASLTGTPGSRTAADWNPYYETANISYNRIDGTSGTPATQYANGVQRVCGTCHGQFHGGPADAEIGGEGTPPEAFKRHPTAGVAIGALTGGHSSLTRFAANTTKVKVATADYSAYTNSSPICLSCHKAHGNQNPFGLVFLNRTATSVDEQGGLGTGQTASTQTGFRNLCGQCHGQGN